MSIASEPAYPSQEYGAHGNPSNGLQVGLTKREYFAAMAMQGILASGSNPLAISAHQNAVQCADAVLEQLARLR